MLAFFIEFLLFDFAFIHTLQKCVHCSVVSEKRINDDDVLGFSDNQERGKKLKNTELFLPKHYGRVRMVVFQVGSKYFWFGCSM